MSPPIVELGRDKSQPKKRLFEIFSDFAWARGSAPQSSASCNKIDCTLDYRSLVLPEPLPCLSFHKKVKLHLQLVFNVLIPAQVFAKVDSKVLKRGCYLYLLFL